MILSDSDSYPPQYIVSNCSCDRQFEAGPGMLTVSSMANSVLPLLKFLCQKTGKKNTQKTLLHS